MTLLKKQITNLETNIICSKLNIKTELKVMKFENKLELLCLMQILPQE